MGKAPDPKSVHLGLPHSHFVSWRKMIAASYSFSLVIGENSRLMWLKKLSLVQTAPAQRKY